MKTTHPADYSNLSSRVILPEKEGISVGNQFSAPKNIEIKICKEAI
jgi:hypothetical protein